MYQNIFITNRTPEEPPTVYLWDDVNDLVIHPYADFDYAYRKDPNGTHTSIYGHKVKKVFSWNDDTQDTFESDVPRETRVLTDVYIDSDELSTGHNLGVLDIEVSSEGGFANIERADREVLSIAFYNKNLDEYVIFLLDPNNKVGDRQKDNVTILSFKTEEDMIQGFLMWYKDQRFTILTGWNVSGFDITYLYRRICVILGEDTAAMLSPVGLLKWSKSRERYLLAGVAVLDYLEMYRKFTYTTRANYRLDTIGQLEVGMRKVGLDKNLDEIYREDIEKFIEYNLHDVRIVVALDKKLKLIELVRGICHAGHVPYEDYAYSSRFIEGTILVYLHRKGIICPNKPIDGQEQMRNREEEKFAGAFVKEPHHGLHEWVFSLDLQSLYPSVIMSLNISPETKVGKVTNWNLDAHMKGDIKEYEVISQGNRFKFNATDFMKFMDTMAFTLSSNGILYLTDKVGIIPEILDKWFKERLEYKALMKKSLDAGDKEQAEYYDKRQHVQKIFLNSIYGTLGLPVFRFYDLDNALAVTASGQDVIKTTAMMINKRYNTAKDECIYIDTDSVYFSAVPLFHDEVTDDQKKLTTIELAKSTEKFVNDAYNTLAKKLFFVNKGHRFVIKGETVAKTGVWITKKRYALSKVYDLDTKRDVQKIIIKGLDVVRSSFPPAFNRFMSKTLENILNKMDKQGVDGTILEFHTSLPQIDYKDIARNTSVKEMSKYDEKTNKSLMMFKKATPLHVKSALIYNRLMKKKGWDKKHTLIRDGDKIKYVYLKQNPLQIDALAFKGFDDPPELIKFLVQYMDAPKLFDTELKGKLEDFYKVLKWGQLPTETNQAASEFFAF